MHSLVEPKTEPLYKNCETGVYFVGPLKPTIDNNAEVQSNGSILIKDIHKYYKEKYGDDYSEIFKMDMKLMEHSKTHQSTQTIWM